MLDRIRTHLKTIDLALRILREQVAALTAPTPVCSRQPAECAALL